MDRLPADFIASVLTLARPGIPAAQRFAGELSGSFGYDADTFTGSAAMPELDIANAGMGGTELVIRDIAVQAEPGSLPALAITGAPVDLGVHTEPLALAAELTPQGYTLHAGGGATLPALAAAARALRLPTASTLGASALAAGAGTGSAGPATAQLALTAAGAWIGDEAADRVAARATGSIRFANVRWSPPWLSVPVRFAALSVSLSPGLMRWSTGSAAIAAGPNAVHFAADASVPFDCGVPESCGAQVSLRTAALDAQALQAALHSSRSVLLSGLLDRIDAGAQAPMLPQASGSIHAGVLTLGRLALRNASAVWTTGEPSGGALLRIQSLDGQALGGAVHLQGTIGWSGDGPRYAVRLLATGVSAADAAQLWNQDWGPGMLGGTAAFTLNGSTSTDLLQSIQGTFHASWVHGSLAPVLPHFASWDGTGTLGPDGLELTRSTLSGTPATVSGRIGWDRTLHLEVSSPDAAPLAISGTLAEPAGN